MIRFLSYSLLFVSLCQFNLVAQNYNACVVNKAIHIVVLGSSTAAGSGPSSIDSAWVNRYRRHIQTINPQNQVTNLGVGGTTTYHIMPDWFSDTTRPTRTTTKNISQAVRLGADAVIINMPSNDASNGFTVAEQLSNFRTIKAVADSFNIKLWVCTTQPRSFSAAKKQIQIEVRDSILAEYGPNSIDFWNGIADSNNIIKTIYNSGDNVHLNGLAHRELNERVIQKLIPNFLVDTLSYADFSIRMIIPENNCGDSSEQVAFIVSNFGPTSLFPLSITVETTRNNQTTSNSLILPANLNSCASDTVFYSLNTYAGGTFQVSAFLNSADTISTNDTTNLTQIERIKVPTIISNDNYHCPTDSAHLTASTLANNSVFWYNSSISSIPIHKGNNLSFLPTNIQTDVYVEAVAGPLHFSENFDLTRVTTTNWNGQMFDIIPKDTLTIDSLEIPINTIGNQKVVAYYRYGSHKNFENNIASWTYWGIDSVSVSAAGDVMPLNYSDLQLIPNDTFAVYIHLLNPSARLAYQTSSSSVFSNSKLDVPSGSGIANTFGTIYHPRNFSGIIHYHYGFNPNGDCQSPRIKVSAIQSTPYLYLGNDTAISATDSLVLNPVGFSNYNWSTGDTTNQIVLNSSNLGIGIHTINLTALDSLGCMNRDTIVVTISNLTNVISHESQTFSISPNPTSGLLKINGELDKLSSILVYNSHGKLILETKQASKEIDLSHLSKGMYFISLHVNSQFYSEKIILK